jgi:prolyl oligopeptidase
MRDRHVDQPPAARVETVTETRFGVTLADPYRWLEALSGPGGDAGGEAMAWLDGQAVYADSLLAGLPLRDEIVARVAELHGQAPDRSAFALAGTRVFCLRRDPEVDLPALVVRDEPDGPERVLLDPAAIQGPDVNGPDRGAGHSGLDWYVPSPSGRYVACGLARGGSERAVLRAVDADDGTLLPDELGGVRHPFVSWTEDERSLIYHRYPDPPAGTPPHRRREDSRPCLHRLGDDPARSRAAATPGCPSPAWTGRSSRSCRAGGCSP